MARKELLEAEKALTRRSDELAKWRQELPWVRINKDYRFETDEGKAGLADLFRGRSQLLVYHFMFGPDYVAGCPSCSSIADGFHTASPSISQITMSCFGRSSRAPIAKLQAYKRRMGWSFPWASSYSSDFNYDFQAARTQRNRRQSGPVEYNFRATNKQPPTPGTREPMDDQNRVGRGNGLGDLCARDAGHERVHTRRRRCVSHLFGVCTRVGRPLGYVPVA